MTMGGMVYLPSFSLVPILPRLLLTPYRVSFDGKGSRLLKDSCRTRPLFSSTGIPIPFSGSTTLLFYCSEKFGFRSLEILKYVYTDRVRFYLLVSCPVLDRSSVVSMGLVT